MVLNLLAGREPLYGLGEWAARFDPTPLGLAHGDAELINDDRVGRALERLFDADRASLLTELMLEVIAEFGVDTTELHNDSTSITRVRGSTEHATGTPRGGKPTPVITFGHSKDHRPDLKQLVWILTVAADGAVPIAYRLADGNTTDDPTHIPTWDQLVALLGRADFLYVADSKLCSREAMGHITAAGGRFVTVLPRSRAEDRWFRDWAQTHQPQWTEAHRLPRARLDEPDQVYSTLPAPLPSAEGHRVVWVHSSAKAARDAAVARGPRRGRRRRGRRPGRPPGRPEVPAQDPGGCQRGRHRGARCRPGPAAGSAPPSARPSRRASGRNAAADPAEHPLPPPHPHPVHDQLGTRPGPRRLRRRHPTAASR